MGFSCSPLWCNLYLMSYEIRFNQRLARLGRSDIMSRHAFQYIDDLCWLNTGHAQIFLDPSQPRLLSNPFWIYPLHIVDIKPEVSRFSEYNASHSIQAHFMNVLVSISDENSGIFMLQKFDKRRSLPFTYMQYIKFHSNRPVKQAYNVVVSQAVPILYLSNDINVALQEINNLISTLTSNGFRRDKLLKLVIMTLTKTTYPAVKFKVNDLTKLLQGMTSHPCTTTTLAVDVQKGVYKPSFYQLGSIHKGERDFKTEDWHADRKWMHVWLSMIRTLTCTY